MNDLHDDTAAWLVFERSMEGWPYGLLRGLPDLRTPITLGVLPKRGFLSPAHVDDLTIIGAFHLAVGLLWSVVLIVITLQLLGLLPHPIQF